MIPFLNSKQIARLEELSSGKGYPVSKRGDKTLEKVGLVEIYEGMVNLTFKGILALQDDKGGLN